MGRVINLKTANEIAAKKDGRCIKAGCNSRDKWLWRCKNGHEWMASYSQIRNGSWCPECRRFGIDKAKAHAKAKGGDCLSDYCQNIFTKLEWICSKGHGWKATPSNVFYKNKWCPTCAGNKKLTIDEAKTEAIKRNGKLLSTEYTLSTNKIDIMCGFGHKFESTPNKIQSGSWCPCCGKKGNEV